MPQTPEAGAAFEDLVRAFRNRPDVDLGKMLKAQALRAGGKSFAYPSEAGLVFKLPKAVVDDLEATGLGSRLVVGKRVMSEWITVPVAEAGMYGALAEQAYGFVRPG